MNLPVNPYVGPRTFAETDERFFFGREREARDLTARILSERLLLFYAQSGAGKSSLIHALVIPALRDRERFLVLSVGRVSDVVPEGADPASNIYAFNLMASLDQSKADPSRLAHMQHFAPPRIYVIILTDFQNDMIVIHTRVKCR